MEQRPESRRMKRPARANEIRDAEFVRFAVHVRMMMRIAVGIVAVRMIAIERREPAGRIRRFVEIEAAGVQHRVERHVAERRHDLMRARIEPREDAAAARVRPR